jgi:flagellin
MGLRIRTNIASSMAQRQLRANTNELHNVMQKLSSGERINKAADDAAGLAISENLRGAIRSLDTAKRNAADGVSMVQITESGLTETSNMLIRLRELAVQAASDTIGNKERGYLEQEYMQLKDEIDRIAMSTEFNGNRMLVGKNELPAEIKASVNAFPLEIQVGKDYFPTADGSSVANPVNIIRVDFGRMNAFTSGEGSLELGKGTEGTRINNKENAQQSITNIDDAMNKVSEHRAYLGAIQNRLTSTLSNLDVQVENMQEANSRIRDADFAAETAAWTRANIMQQAGTAVLANANAQPQVALALLSGHQ